MNSNRISEVDGLRAFAVVVVVAHHAGALGFGGGYFGVDVFFVISGFVITLKTLREVEEGNFSIWEFYRRRLRRILPAAVFILSVATYFAHRWLLPSDYVGYAETLKSALTFRANFQIGAETGYFSPETLFMPLAHLWSLSIEEQFYLVFPLVVFLFPSRNRMLFALWTAFLFSALHLALRFGDPTMSYFATANRIAQLSLGGLCALWTFRDALGQSQSRVPRIASSVCLVGLCLLVPIYSSTQAIPSMFSVLPVGLTAVFLILPSSKVGTKVLSWKPIQMLGLSSYSIYLIHQPLMAFSRTVIYGTPYSYPTATEKLLMVAGCLFLGVTLWHLLEEPVRRSRGLTEAVLLALIVASGLILYGHANTVIREQGIPDRVPSEATYQLQRREAAMASENGLNLGNCVYLVSIQDLPRLERNSKYTKCISVSGWPVLVAGDSHAQDLLNALSLNLPARHFVGVLRNDLSHASFSEQLASEMTELEGIFKSILFTMEASTWISDNTVQVEQLKQDSDRMLASFKSISNSTQFVWLGPQVEPRVDLFAFNPLVGTVREQNTVRLSERLSRKVDQILQELSERAKIRYISKMEIIDFKYASDFEVEEGYTYSDRTHWSTVGEKVFGSRLVSDPLLRELLFACPLKQTTVQC